MRELLVKYMMNVIDKEGISFLYQWNDSDGLFLEADYEELKKIEAEAIENLKKHYEQNKN